MKTNEELNALKNDVENVNEKPHKLTPEELEQVTGGVGPEVRRGGSLSPVSRGVPQIEVTFDIGAP